MRASYFVSGSSMPPQPSGITVDSQPTPVHLHRDRQAYKRNSRTRKQVRILVLDGGGVRGLSSLLVLNELMKRVRALEGHPACTAQVRPCDFFDLIVGTGTGGLSALFLGRLRMTVRQSIEEFILLTRATTSDWSKGPHSRTGDAFERVFGNIIQRFLGSKDVRLRILDAPGIARCHTAVFVSDRARSGGSQLRLFKSYASTSDNTILDIARASVSSQSGRFSLDPEKLARVVDEGHNPAEIALSEAMELWPGSSIKCIVSLGTGLHHIPRLTTGGLPNACDNDAWSKMGQLYDTIVCDRVHDRVSHICSSNGIPYFRFNVDRGDSESTVESCTTLVTVGAIVEAYMQSSIVSTQLDTSASLLRVAKARSPEPFSTSSSLCLDGKISNRSEFQVTSGGYADIWTGSMANQTVAIKIMRPFSSGGSHIDGSKLLKRLWREYLAWSRLSHPNILKCLGYSYDFTPQSDPKVPSLISRWMSNGDVLTYTKANPDTDRLEIVVGIARGLAYLHNRKPVILHGDIRAGNVLISEAGIPCLTDFGLSRVLSKTRGMTTSSEVAGSLRWMARELFNGKNLSLESDVWAYGMTVLETFTGTRPFSELALEPLVLYEILRGKHPARPALTDAPFLTDDLWKLCQSCWDIQPSKRPRMVDVLAKVSRLGEGTTGRKSR